MKSNSLGNNKKPPRRQDAKILWTRKPGVGALAGFPHGRAAGASQLAQTAECGSATQVGAVGSADPVSTATYLCIVDQSYREAVAQAEAGVGAHARFGR